MSKFDPPLVSIIIPSYNQGAFIKETIDSILSQDYRPLEIIVIDGASTDNTIDILRSYKDLEELRWISEPDNGVVEAVNKGFSLAQGDIIGIQSSDDLYLPHAVKTMVKALQSNSEVGLAFADMITINSEGKELRRTNFPPFSLEGFLSKEFFIPQPSAFFRRELLETLGGWNKNYFVADTEFWLRAVFCTQVIKVNDCISQRRLHNEQRNNQIKNISDSYWSMINNSQDLKTSSNKLKRLAKSGAHLNSLRYNGTGSYWLSSYHLWMAIFYRPLLLPTWLGSPFLIPGYLSCRVFLSQLRQKFVHDCN